MGARPQSVHPSDSATERGCRYGAGGELHDLATDHEQHVHEPQHDHRAQKYLRGIHGDEWQALRRGRERRQWTRAVSKADSGRCGGCNGRRRCRGNARRFCRCQTDSAPRAALGARRDLSRARWTELLRVTHAPKNTSVRTKKWARSTEADRARGPEVPPQWGSPESLSQYDASTGAGHQGPSGPVWCVRPHEKNMPAGSGWHVLQQIPGL